MTHDQILKELKAGQYRPVYLLMGDETYPIDLISNYIEQNALPDDAKPFNQTVVYGRDTNGHQITHECEQYPTFADRRVVIVKEAQTMPGLSDLDPYAAHPLTSTVLVLCHKYKSVDKRLKLTKSIEKSGGAILESKKLYDNQMPAWITQYVIAQGLSIEEKASLLLAEHVGTSQTDAVSAVDKIRLAVPDLKTVTADMVSTHTGISKEYNAFELRDALFKRDRAKAMKIIHAFGNNEKAYPVQPILAALYNGFDHLFTYTFTLATTRNPKAAVDATLAVGERSSYMVSKTYEPAAKLFSASDCMRICEMLADYDMRSKGFNFPAISNRDMLVDIVARIIN